MKNQKMWVMIELAVLVLSVGAAIYVGISTDAKKAQENASESQTEASQGRTETTESSETAKTESATDVDTTAAETIPTEAETTVAETTRHPENGLIIVIDAGHRANGGWSETEPNGPGSTTMKAKLTTGTACTVNDVYYTEHEVNLNVALKLQAELEARGYTVVQLRSTGESSLSNADRAVLANEAHADAFVRIHCNGSDNASVNGVTTYSPSPTNPYLADYTFRGETLTSASIRLSTLMAEAISEYTGAKNGGVMYSDTMTGINWCQVPVTIVEMGFMSNPDEAAKLVSDGYQTKMAYAIANGIDAFLK